MCSAFFVEPEILVKVALENRQIRDRVRLFSTAEEQFMALK